MAPGKGELVTPGCMPTLYPSWFKWLEIYGMNLPWRGFNRALPVQHYQSMCNQTLTFELYMFQAVLKRATVTCIVTQVVAIFLFHWPRGHLREQSRIQKLWIQRQHVGLKNHSSDSGTRSWDSETSVSDLNCHPLANILNRILASTYLHAGTKLLHTT
jgi:hypothetical protein